MKKEIIERVLSNKTSISNLAREYAVSRQVIFDHGGEKTNIVLVTGAGTFNIPVVNATIQYA